MKRCISFLLVLILVGISFSAKQKKLKNSQIKEYCDLKKNLKVAIVKVKDKSARSPIPNSQAYKDLGRNVYVSIGDAELVRQPNSPMPEPGSEISDE